MAQSKAELVTMLASLKGSATAKTTGGGPSIMFDVEAEDEVSEED